MGLMDVLTGMRNGPGGGLGGGGVGGAMSPILMAALGLLAYKAVKGVGSQQAPPTSAGASASGGGLGDILGSLGLGGAAARSTSGTGLVGILSGGLGDLVRQFQNAGKGEIAETWVGTGQNKQIAAQDLATVLTPDQIEFLTKKTGMKREELLAGLSNQLPEVVDALTPEGRIPAPHEFNRTA
ncbi:MAG: YidB family protein [Reyranella sp.]|nr:YidB family protein [Reyranella sp.]